MSKGGPGTRDFSDTLAFDVSHDGIAFCIQQRTQIIMQPNCLPKMPNQHASVIPSWIHCTLSAWTTGWRMLFLPLGAFFVGAGFRDVPHVAFLTFSSTSGAQLRQRARSSSLAQLTNWSHLDKALHNGGQV